MNFEIMKCGKGQGTTVYPYSVTEKRVKKAFSRNDPLIEVPQKTGGGYTLLSLF